MSGEILLTIIFFCGIVCRPFTKVFAILHVSYWRIKWLRPEMGFAQGGDRMSIQSGIVKFYQPMKGWGFIVTDAGEEIFFHINDYCSLDNRTTPDRNPRNGDPLVFKVVTDRQGRPKASPWEYKSEYGIVRVSKMKRIIDSDIRHGDVSVKTFGRGGHNPLCWDDIIYRPASHEFLRIQCWDGEWSSYQPNLPNGDIPDGITIVDDM